MTADAIATLMQGAGPWTPHRLIAVICQPALRSGFRPSAREDANGCDWHAGFCGYVGKDSYAKEVDGFDNGEQLWAELTASGWTLLEDPGSREFPFTFLMEWRPRELEHEQAAFEAPGGRGVERAETIDALTESADGHWCLLHASEGDLGIAVYDDETAYRAAERTARRA
jgi:hypothetical protein